MTLEQAIGVVRERVRGKNAESYIKRQKKNIIKEFDLNENQFYQLLARLKGEQERRDLESDLKIEDVPPEEIVKESENARRKREGLPVLK